MTFRDWQQFSPEEAARELLRRVGAFQSPAQRRAVIALLPGEEELTENFARADRSAPLGGVPYFLKDLFDVAGKPTFAGSTFLPEVRPTPSLDSHIVTALRSAGAVFAGKTHLHEFAYGITGENPHYGDCKHPRFPGRTTGGSSSGSAAIVASSIAPLAIGTDTGGSVRVPAAFCGLFGFRAGPSDTLIADAFPLAPSLDTAGWFTADANDMAVALTALVNPKTGIRNPRGCYLELPGLDADVAAACRAAAADFAGPADALTQADLLNRFERSLEIYSNIVAAEAWRVHLPWAQRFKDRYDPAVWQRLQRGATLSQGTYEAAQRDMAAVRTTWADYFRTFDFLILPATPIGALSKAECTALNRNRLLALTAPASLGGCPVLTIPVTLPSGLTSGLQIVVSDAKSEVLLWALRR